MSLDEILAAPGFPVDEDAANGIRVILECLEEDFAKDGFSEVEPILPGYDNKCVTVTLKTYSLSGTPRHGGKYLADLFRIPDAVGIFPAKDGSTRIMFSSVVWE